MKNLRQTIEAQLEAQRWAASQASREQSSETLKANALERWAELFEAGYYSEARRVWKREFEQA